jgi:tetratricopeptide (TPR) repeat protein
MGTLTAVFLVLAVLGALGAGPVIVFTVRWAWRRWRRQPEPKPATEERLARLDDRVQRLQRTVDGLKEAFNHYFPIAEKAAEQLVATSDEERLRLLTEATKAQREHRYAEAIELLEPCLRPGLPAAERAALHNLIGNSYMYMGQPAQAQPHYREVLAAANETQDDQARATALGNLGSVYLERGDLDKAEQHHKKALAIFEEIGDRLGQANQFGNLGLVYADRGELDKAEEHHKRALAIDEEIGNRLGQAADLNSLGSVYFERREVDHAEEHYMKALEIHHQIDDRLGEATALRNLGLVHTRAGNLSQALRYVREARRIFAEARASREVEKADELIKALEQIERPSPPEPKPKSSRKRPPPKP